MSKKKIEIKRIDLIRGKQLLHYRWNASGKKIPVYSEYWQITDVDNNHHDEHESCDFVCPESNFTLIPELNR